ncbi:GDP-L-fucose synthase family protein [Piscinibacter defluvii]|uniref:GDP-L-fucose synthase family protein n=1 Tax=Piscinibacter defluvii TaxID=1796922 RepID=UPI00197CA0F0|nr:GDP-L-fucose synthase [Piscinibacter defluvii]
MIDQDSLVYVAGHRGMVGSALVRALRARGYHRVLTRTRDELDLLDQRAVFDFLAAHRPQYVFVAAARVGGIEANRTQPAEFLFQNLQIAANLIEGAHRAGIASLMYFASNCIYPRDCVQPMPESALLTGALEPTNEAYAVAKIAGLKLAEAHRLQHGRAYVSVMPASLYGPNDNYTPGQSHVLPALLRRAHEARERGAAELLVWGSGTPRREFLYVDDLAQACVMLAETGYADAPLNIGCGSDLSIRELAQAVVATVGFEGALVFDASKPDGMPRKLLDSSRINALGWRPTVGLREGLARAYACAPWRSTTTA